MRIQIVFSVIIALASCAARPPAYQIVEADGDVVRLSRAAVDDGEVHFFTYRHKGENVNFIVRTDGEGELHTHFDACYSCYRYRRGFVVEGPDLVCVACRYTYRIEEQVWDFIGACAPITFHFRIDSESLIIKRKVLDRGSRFFS